MTQYYSRIDATLNGDVYNIPFSYMKESEISVYINDEPITAWEFLNESQIKINEMPSEIPADAIVSIRRTTDITKKVVDYTNQSMLKKESLNKSQDQLLNAIQEVYDNNLNFRINTDEKIEDFKTEVNDTIKEVNEAASKINELEASVNLATESAINAEQSALLASEKAELTIDKIEELENKTLQIDLNTEKINENAQAINSNTQAILTKANTALNNLTDEGKELITIYSLPSENYIDLTIGSTGASYTAPANGWVYYDARSNGNANSQASINVCDDKGTTLYSVTNSIATNGHHMTCFLPIKKNQTFKVFYQQVSEQLNFRFIYAQGEI